MTQLNKLQNALAGLGVDAVIISSELNQFYLSGFEYTDGYLFITQKDAYLLADFRYTEAARAAVKNFTIIRPEGRMIDGLKKLIAEHGCKSVALEDASLSCADYKKFSEAFVGTTLCTGASDILSDLRAVKTPEELEKIAKSQSITDRAFTHILGFISDNLGKITERDVALELEFFMRRAGAQSVAFQTIAVSGAASSLPHGVPSDVLLRQGFLTMDFGALCDGYCSDMTRTVVIGKADDEIKKVYNTVLAAQTAALDAIHEGMLCRDADEIARRVIRDAGWGDCFGHGLGHGVGLFIHEAPRVSSAAPEDSRLVRGNVVTVEPGIYLEGLYGCRIEDMIAIEHDGSVRNFTKSPKHLIEI